MATLNSIVEERLRRALAVLSKHAQIRAAYIFGSQVEGTADADSDIDLAVFVEGLENWDLVQRARTSALIQREAGDVIDVHFFPVKALTDADPASFAAFILHRGLRVTSSGKAA
jgi:predicted nucleotidyltransferase